MPAVFASYVLVGLDRPRVVVDPDERNERAIARFTRQGFERGPVVVLPEVDLPEVYLPGKRARPAFLRRESVLGRRAGERCPEPVDRAAGVASGG